MLGVDMRGAAQDAPATYRAGTSVPNARPKVSNPYVPLTWPTYQNDDLHPRALTSSPQSGGTLPEHGVLSDLLEHGRRIGVALDGARVCHLLEQLYVVGDDLELAGDAILEAVLLSPRAQQLGDGRIVVARHSREDVVLQLPLHTAPQHMRDRVVALGVARRAELRLDEVVLAQRVAQEDLLRLVGHLRSIRRARATSKGEAEAEAEAEGKREGGGKGKREREAEAEAEAEAETETETERA